MENEIFISYIVPCYNVQRYLPKCLESLAIQKIKEGKDIEFILVNDGSSDGTLSLLNAFAAKDKRARVIDQKNQGVCAARNHGLELAKGKYVYFHDGDDILTDEASQLVKDLSKNESPDIIIPNAYSVDEDDLDNEREWNTFTGLAPGTYEAYEFAKKITRLPVSVKVYKRELLTKNGVRFDEDLKVGEVYTFFIHALAYSNFVALTERRMMKWVIRSSGTTKGNSLIRDTGIISTMHHIDRYADLCKFNVKTTESYHISLFMIANLFSFYKYSKDYSSGNVEFLKSVKKDIVYKNTLKYFLFQNPHLGRKYLDIAILYFFPIKIYFLKRKLKAMVKRIQKR